MLPVMTIVSSTSVLARFFKLFINKFFTRRAVIFAALLMCFTLFPPTAFANDAVSVTGPPEWLSRAAERAVNAVWGELKQHNMSQRGALKTLVLVGSRLFNGYSVTVDPNDPVLHLVPRESPQWSLDIKYPELDSPMISWLSEDMAPVQEEILQAVESVSPGALSWAERDFREYTSELMAEYVPGWRLLTMVRIKGDKAVLEVSPVPEPPLILVTTPAIYSSSLPNFLRDGLKSSLLKDLSPMAGLPVKWIEFHKDDVELWGKGLLEKRNTVAKSLSDVKVSITPGLVSKVDASVESSRYSFRIWLAAYAGVTDRPPEFGLHLGRNIQVLPGWNSEFYAELLLDLDDFDLEDRWGLRWNLKGPVYIGAEYSFPDSLLWYRLWLKGNTIGPYMWVRYSERDESQISVGYRVNQRISIELNYDDRYDDRVSIRAVGDL